MTTKSRPKPSWEGNSTREKTRWPSRPRRRSPKRRPTLPLPMPFSPLGGPPRRCPRGPWWRRAFRPGVLRAPGSGRSRTWSAPTPKSPSRTRLTTSPTVPSTAWSRAKPRPLPPSIRRSPPAPTRKRPWPPRLRPPKPSTRLSSASPGSPPVRSKRTNWPSSIRARRNPVRNRGKNPVTRPGTNPMRRPRTNPKTNLTF